VASEYVAGMEDRTHDRDPCAQLDIVPGNHGIHSKDNGVLQAAEHDVAKGKEKWNDSDQIFTNDKDINVKDLIPVGS
jgi:hypothetical protein